MCVYLPILCFSASADPVKQKLSLESQTPHEGNYHTYHQRSTKHFTTSDPKNVKHTQTLKYQTSIVFNLSHFPKPNFIISKKSNLLKTSKNQVSPQSLHRSTSIFFFKAQSFNRTSHFTLQLIPRSL